MDKNIFSVTGLSTSDDVIALHSDYEMTMKEIMLTVENSELKLDLVQNELTDINSQIEIAFDAVASCMTMDEVLSNKDMPTAEANAVLTRESSKVNLSTGILFFEEELTTEASIGENLKKLWEILKKALKAAKDMLMKAFKKLNDFIKSVFNKKRLAKIRGQLAVSKLIGLEAFTKDVEELRAIIVEHNQKVDDAAIMKKVNLMNLSSIDGLIPEKRDRAKKLASNLLGLSGSMADKKIDLDILPVIDIENEKVDIKMNIGKDTSSFEVSEEPVDKKDIKLSDIVTKEQLEMVGKLKIFNHIDLITFTDIDLSTWVKNNKDTGKNLTEIVDAIKSYAKSGTTDALKKLPDLKDVFPVDAYNTVDKNKDLGFGVWRHMYGGKEISFGSAIHSNKSSIAGNVEDDTMGRLENLSENSDKEQKDFEKWSNDIEKTLKDGYEALDKVVAAQMSDNTTSQKDIDGVKEIKYLLDEYSQLPKDLLAYKAITLKVAEKYTEMLITGK